MEKKSKRVGVGGVGGWGVGREGGWWVGGEGWGVGGGGWGEGWAWWGGYGWERWNGGELTIRRFADFSWLLCYSCFRWACYASSTPSASGYLV